ncbi:MAG TPA: dockerin type I domain-containing protein [Candidatus Limnocylindrales bacterium]|nr:dockerin type I domain-containing protein [Candidatus Limnocylindrales bacterium]
MKRLIQKFKSHPSLRSRKLLILASCLLVAIIGTIMLFKSRAAVVYNVPASIAADCSRNVQAEITNFIKTVPDDSTIQFPVNGCYMVDNRIEVIKRSGLSFEGQGSKIYNNGSNKHDDGVRPAWFIMTSRNINFRNFVIEGVFKQVGTPELPQGLGNLQCGGPPGTIFCADANAGFYVAGVDGMVLDNNTVRDVWGDCVVTIASGNVDPEVGIVGGGMHNNNILVNRLHCSRTARLGVAPTDGHNITIQDSDFHLNWYAGIDAEIDTNIQTLHNLRIERNTFEDYSSYAISVPANANVDGAIDGVYIFNNTAIDTPLACLGPINVGYYPTLPAMYHNVYISDNNLRAYSGGVGLDHVKNGHVHRNKIELLPGGGCSDTYPVAVLANNSENILACENILTNYLPSDTAAQACPAGTDTSNPTNTTAAPPSAPAYLKGTTKWGDGTTTPKSAAAGTMPSVSIQAAGAQTGIVYYAVSGQNGCTTDIKLINGTPFNADGNGNIAATSGTINDGGGPRPAGTYDVCFQSGNGTSATAPVTITIGTGTTPAPTPNPTPTPAPTPNPTPTPTPTPSNGMVGQTLWGDGTSAAQSGNGTSVTVSANGATPGVVYYLYSGLNNCTTDLREMGVSAMLPDSSGKIAPVTGSIKLSPAEGGQIRSAGTYNICFTRGDGSTRTAPLIYTVTSSSSPVLPPSPTTPSGKTGDLNNDNKVNIFDLSILLSHWNTNNRTGDLNNSGKVDIIDLSILLSKYGT